MSTVRILTPRQERTARPHRPKDASATGGSWIVETGGAGGGGGGAIPAAPPVTINGPAEVSFLGDGIVQVDALWTKAATANSSNFLGVAVYLEDPDISDGPNIPLDGSVALDGSAQLSGTWAPVFVNDCVASPAVVFPDSAASYKTTRNVRIYLAAYGPNTQPVLVRATDPNPTPNILVEIAQGPGSYQSAMEWAFLVNNVEADVITDFNRPDPNYYLKFFYTPPDPTAPPPPGANGFGGCRIIYVEEDSGGNPQLPGTNTGIDVPVAQSQIGYKSPVYTASAGGSQFRAYFCSEDNALPLGTHINSLVEGVTPYAEVIVPPVPGAPDVTSFTISGEKDSWQLDGTFIAEATLAWSLPTQDLFRYAGVFLYLVKVTGSVQPLTKFPQALVGQQSNVDTGFLLEETPPANPEVWTIAAISVDADGVLADDPKKYGQASFHSPTVTWNIGPPTPGTACSGQEYAPLVTVNASPTVTATQTTSSDGVGMVSFQVGAWTNPTSGQFGGAKLAMVVNHNVPTCGNFPPFIWTIPANATAFTTPAIPSFGNIGASVPVDFYIVSFDPKGNQNSLVPGTTPVINYTYTPVAGAIIPARSGWFDSEFAWPAGGQFQAQQFAAQKIYVGSQLVVGGAPSSFNGPNGQNGQIAAKDASGKLVAWMGESEPNLGQGQGNAVVYGGWFGNLYVGGTSPLDAPIFIDQYGVIEVGGIAAAQGSKYPYVSIRDQTGLEMGRIGAQISAPSGTPGDSTGSSPPSLTAGAWFTQLAVGGSNLSNWNVLIKPTATGNPLGSDFLMRNIYLLSIDYPAQSGNPANAEYKLEFGSSVWMAGGLTGASWQFPGIHIYEVDGSGNNFGSTFLSRGMVLRGPGNQGYPVLVSLVAWNGQSSGADNPNAFIGQLTMYSPASPNRATVVLASGVPAPSGSGGYTSGNGNMAINDVNGNALFSVNTAGSVSGFNYSVNGFGQVIDSAGNWTGKPISGGQTPWVANINGAGFSLNNAGTVQCSTVEAAQFLNNSSQPMINNLGQFVGFGVNVGSYGVGCGGVTCSGPVSCTSMASSGSAHVDSLYTSNMGSYGSGDVSCVTLHVNGVLCAQNGIWGGNGVQCNSAIYGSQFGISGVAVGWTGTYPTNDGRTVHVNGGIIINVA